MSVNARSTVFWNSARFSATSASDMAACAIKQIECRKLHHVKRRRKLYVPLSKEPISERYETYLSTTHSTYDSLKETTRRAKKTDRSWNDEDDTRRVQEPVLILLLRKLFFTYNMVTLSHSSSVFYCLLSEWSCSLDVLQFRNIKNRLCYLYSN